MLCQRQGSEGHAPPHALKSSERGCMISDFGVSNLESSLRCRLRHEMKKSKF